MNQLSFHSYRKIKPRANFEFTIFIVSSINDKCSSTVKQLKVIYVWHGMDQSVIDNAIDEWRGRLRTCVRANVGQFEQLL